MYCKHCGELLSDASHICTACGDEGSRKTIPRCQSCGYEYAPDKRFCRRCGAALPQTPAPAQNGASEKPVGKRRKTALMVILSAAGVLAIAAVVLLFVIPVGGGIQGEMIKDGTVQMDGVVVRADIPNKAAALTVKPAGQDMFDGNAASDIAVIEYTEKTQAQVTVSLPLYENDGGLYMMAVGTEVYGKDGGIVTVYRYYDVGIEDDVATASFVPADVLSDEVQFASSTDRGLRPPWLRTNAVLFSASQKVASGPDGTTHFRLTYPKKFSGRDYFSQEDLIALFGIFEEVFDMYQQDYSYKYAARTKYPLDVYIEPLGDEGDGYFTRGAFIDGATITLNTRLFYSSKDKKFDPEAGNDSSQVKGTFAHEFFHFVQANYSSPYTNCSWLDEATSTYFESLINTGYLDSIDMVNDNWKKVYDGIFPPSDTADHGYARMPLIEFLVNKTQDVSFIRSLYAKYTSGWEDAVIAETELRPVDYAVEFYSDLLLQKVKSYREPIAIYWGAFWGEGDKSGENAKTYLDTNGVCSYWSVLLPDYEKVKARLDQEGELKLADTAVRVPAYGARLLALDLTANITVLEPYPDELELEVWTSTPGCEVRLLEIDEDTRKAVFVDEAKITNLKDKLGKGYLYLVLLVSLSDSPQDFQVQASAVTGDPQEYVWGLVDIKPYRLDSFGQTELLGEEFSISATASSCSIQMTETILGKTTVRSAIYTMPGYLEANQPYQPSIPITHSNFEFYCMFDGALDLAMNADKTAFAYKGKAGLIAPGTPGEAAETHTIMVGMYYSNMKVGAEYVYKWMPKKNLSASNP